MSKFTDEEDQLKQKIISLQKQNTRLSKQVNDLIRQKSGFLENEQRYKEAQAIGYLGNWEYDITAKKLWGSEEARKIFGFDPRLDQFTLEEIENCITAREKVHNALLDLIEKNKEYDLVYEIITADTGKKKIIHSKARLEKDHQGKPIKVSGIIADISERHEIASNLKESEELFRILSETTPSAIMIYQNDTWVYVNDAATRISGYSREDLLQMNFWEFVHPEFKDLVKHLGFKRQQKINVKKNYEFKIITKEGEIKWVWLNGASTVYRGKPAGIITIDDITEFKNAQIKIQESEERFKFLTDSTFEGIVVHNRGIVIDTNDAFLKMVGYTREEVIGENLIEYIPEAKDREKIRSNLLKRKSSPYRITGVRKDGSEFKAELEARNVRRAGEMVRIVAVRDVTKRVELEKKALEIRERYRSIFNSVPVSIWEEDFSEAYRYIQTLKSKGITDFQTYFSENPQEVEVCSGKVKIRDINKTTLSLFNAPSKEVFYRDLSAIFTDVSLETFKDQLIKISNNETFYEGKCVNRTFDGELLNVYLRWHTMPGREKDYSRVLVSLLDETEKEKAVEALRESKRQITAIMNDPATFLGLIEPDGTLLSANDSALNFIGKSLSDVIGNKFWDTPWWSHSKELQEKLKTSIEKAALGNTIHFEADHVGHENHRIYVNFSIRPVIDTKGNIRNLIVEGLDMTDQKLAEEKVNKLLEEKEMLLREVHHRIKNNMATVESLFKIKSMMSKDEKVKTAFQEAISRLSSMRILYDRLYLSSDLKSISLQEYLPGLAREVVAVFPLGSEVDLKLDIDNITIPADVNFPLCIMINELITNAMKYAFNDSIKQKTITLKAKIKKSLVTITIMDNGLGLPEDFNFESSKGFGVKLCKNLAKQIKGEISYSIGTGTSWTITFNV